MKQKTWDEVVQLVAVQYTQDELKNSICVEDKAEVFANRRSVPRSERYVAGQSEIAPHEIFVVHAFEYDNQPYLEHEGIRYSIVGTFDISKDEIELKCRRKVSDRNGD